jgi:hypothetical protein
MDLNAYEGVSKRFRTESITKYTLTIINTRWEATQRVMMAKLTRLTHKIAIQLHLVAESYTICSSRSRLPVRNLLEAPSYTSVKFLLRKWQLGTHPASYLMGALGSFPGSKAAEAWNSSLTSI